MDLKILVIALFIFNICFGLIFYSVFFGGREQQAQTNEQIRRQIKIVQQVNVIPEKRKSIEDMTESDRVAFTLRKKELFVNIFRTLYSYPQIDKHYYLGDTTSGQVVYTFFDQGFFGLKQEDDYCQRSDEYFLLNKQEYFEDINIYTNYISNNLIRTRVINVIGDEVEPRSSLDMPSQIKSLKRYNLKVNTQAFFTRTMMHLFFELGKNFGCFFQMYNVVLGHSAITRKDYFAKTIKEYKKQYANKPQCFDSSTFYPKSYLLSDIEDCQNFFKELQSSSFQELKKTSVVQFLVKNGDNQHTQNSVQILNSKKERKLNHEYQQGEKCGNGKQYSIVIQKYMSNPLLINNYKFDFKLYMLVASTDPLIIYYHDGYLRLAEQQYDKMSNDIKLHITSNYQQNQPNQQTTWNLEKLQEYLIQNKKINDPNWINNYLRPSFQRAIVHLGRMLKPHILQDHRVFDLFGVDFMMDENLNVYFVDAQVIPSIKSAEKQNQQQLADLLIDMFEIIFNYMRSRARRIFALLENASEEQVKFEEDVETDPNEDQIRRKKLLDINNLSIKFNQFKQNYFDTKFKLKKSNSWIKVVDQNLGDTRESTHDLLDKSCFK